MAKARFGGDETGPNPTDRAKPGTKRSLLVEADGRPLAVVIGGANIHAKVFFLLLSLPLLAYLLEAGLW